MAFLLPGITAVRENLRQPAVQELAETLQRLAARVSSVTRSGTGQGYHEQGRGNVLRTSTVKYRRFSSSFMPGSNIASLVWQSWWRLLSRYWLGALELVGHVGLAQCLTPLLDPRNMVGT